MKYIKNKMNKINVWWKVSTLFLVAIICVFVATRFVKAETVSLSIEGNDLSDGSWEVGGEPAVWNAQAFDAEINGYLNLDDGGSIQWESSDRTIVDVTQSSSGTVSTATLRPVSAGKVTITATYTKTVTTDDGSYDIVASAKRNVVVKFKIDETRIPQAPYEDNFLIPNILTNSEKPVTWYSSNESVVKIDDDGSGNGVVNVVGSGKTTITAVSYDGQKQSFPMVINAKFLETTSDIKVGYKEYYNLTTNAVHANDIVFKSENPSIISVDTDGVIRGESAGQSKIYVYALGENDEWFSLLPDPARYITASVDFEITADSTKVAVGDALRIKSNVSNASSGSINWTSSNTSVATVDTNGVVTALKKGIVTINATAVDEKVFGTTDLQKAAITIEVIDSFSLSATQHILNVSETFDLYAIVTDTSADVIWNSSNPNIAKVEVDRENNKKAVVEAVGKGTATITATQIIDGVSKTATCEISVKDPVLNVDIFPAQVEISKGEMYRLVLTFNPSRPDNMNVKWVSSDEKVVKVDDQGIITGLGGGQAAVSVISEDGIKVASCTVRVRVPVTFIKLDVNQVTTSLSTGSYQLTYTLLPDDDGVNRDVTWTSSAPDIATVGNNGLVTFLKPGKATIIVKTVDTGVDGNLIDTCEFYINNPVKDVKLDYTNITLKLKEKFRLTAKVSPDDASNKKILWFSSDTNVATVNEDGMVTAVGSGSATILAKSEDSGATSMCNVTVYQPVTEIKLSNDKMTVRKGTVFWLNAKVLPENAMNKDIMWSTTDEDVAIVDENGKVTTYEPGDCVIIATSTDSGVIAKCQLTVTQPITGIYLNITEKTILKGKKFILVPTVTPSDADNKNVIYTSSDPSIATVDNNGVVTGVKGGVAIIVAKTQERGLIASCSVEVQEFVSSVTIESDNLYMHIGDVKQLQAKVLPDSATNSEVTWATSNSSIISVNSKGKLTANNVGKATVYVYSSDGSGLYDTIEVEVINPVKTITVSPTTTSVQQGKSTKVTATVSPADATYKNVEWSSSNSEIATVDSAGNIIGLNPGSCKIIATATDGTEIFGVCNLTVTPIRPATSVVINSKEITMLPGQTRTLSARLRPTNSTESVMWISGDTSVATVDSNGLVTAKGQGNTEIYAVSNETGVETSCVVNVLALNATYVTLEQYDSYDLDVFGATENIKWYSNNKRVATISADGKLIGRMAGTTTIMAKVNGKVLYCTVKVTTMY